MHREIRVRQVPLVVWIMGAAFLTVVAVLTLYISTDWVTDLGPVPDAQEYATTARGLAHGGPYSLLLLGHHYPPRYPFGFPVFLVPAYWLPHATLANGIYAVTAFGVVTSLLVYRLAGLLCGPVAGILAAVMLLTLPQFELWGRQIMSETASTALTVAAGLLLYHASIAPNPPQRTRLLVALGFVCGLAILVHLTNAALSVAGILALLSVRAMRERFVLNTLALSVGPAAAIVILGVYNVMTFGGVSQTGYTYWVPQWYASLGSEFSASYALTGPGLRGDGLAPTHMPNSVYYARALAGVLPHESLLVLSGWVAALAVIGLTVLARDSRPGARVFLSFTCALTLITLCTFSLYFFQATRFLAAVTPLATIAAGIGARAGIGALAVGLRRRHVTRIVMGASISAVTVLGLWNAVGAGVQGSYLYHAYILRDPIPIQGNSWTAALYRRYVHTRSIIVTDVVVPFLDDQGITRIARIVPLSRGEYWDKPPLHNPALYVNRYRAIDRALHAGTPVYTDAPTVSVAFINRTVDPGSWRALQAHHLVPVGARGPDIIYRLELRGQGGR